jgi:hypothetical protein
MDILVGISRELASCGVLTSPTVWLDPSMGEDLLGRSREAVKKLSGQLADVPSDLRITHKVYGLGQPDNGKHYATVVETRCVPAWILQCLQITSHN